MISRGVLGVVVMTLATTLPLTSADPSQFTFFDVPYPVVGPCDVCEGPDGAVWIQAIKSPYFARFDPVTRTFTHYLIPFTTPLLNVTLPPEVSRVLGKAALGCGIRPGLDGYIYATNGLYNQLIRVNTTTGEVKIAETSGALGNLDPLNDLSPAQNGVWFTMTTANKIGFLPYTGGQVLTFNVPTPASIPTGIFHASDGYVYFTELTTNKIGVLYPLTGVIVEIPLPPGCEAPSVIRAQTPSGGRSPFIWISASSGNSMCRLDPNTNKTKVYRNPLNGDLVAGHTKDSYENIWFITTVRNVLGKVDHLHNNVSVTSIPIDGVPADFLFALNYGPENALWFLETFHGKLGRYSLNSLNDYTGKN
ncbi:unnamed protein product [Bemisia tabaci]|uniref:SMP-30/Gluconolactonase/LRE-like region domain-containing protein n=1 Tax=Bemisia tabaci TaxID=7038 RepID=A0A9P0A2H4_BEMTA|nr:unnamed protein product [Bemisia tabaci]